MTFPAGVEPSEFFRKRNSFTLRADYRGMNDLFLRIVPPKGEIDSVQGFHHPHLKTDFRDSFFLLQTIQTSRIIYHLFL